MTAKHRTIRISGHAVTRYLERTGRKFSATTAEEIQDAVFDGTVLSPAQVVAKGFKLSKQIRRDVYVLMRLDDKSEPVLGIIAKDNTLKTILTKDMFLDNSQKSELLRRRIQEVEDVLSM